MQEVHGREAGATDLTPWCTCFGSLVSQEREFFIDNLLVRNHFIIVMIRWTGLAPWEFEFPFPGSLTSTILSRWYLNLIRDVFSGNENYHTNASY